ncbi:MAG: peptidase S41 [Elusimicrobia bacterium]|nr:MAG: peptidase S41 [Elusimicrobiota bacterium]
MKAALREKFKTITVAVCLAALGVWLLPRAYAAADNTYEQLKVLVDVLDYIKENYVEEIDSTDLVRGAARGMVGTLDPFSQFMEPKVHKEIKTETEGQFGGLGIRIGMREQWLTVITPIPGTPAYKAGVLPQDRIIKIEEDSTKGITLTEAVTKLRGKPGTKIKITVARDNTPDVEEHDWSTHEITITREIIKIESVQSRMLENKTGYVKILEFSAHTADDTVTALGELKKAGSTSLVLDLRNNPGGLLTAAVDVASFFLGDNRLIVYTQGRAKENRQDFRAGSRSPYSYLPMVVLINGGSASGSEIVAGALQDHKRAVIVGSRSFGKASVQSVIPLSDGSGLRLTVAKYYTPAGRGIQRNEKEKTGGISPDFAVTVTREAEVKLQAQGEMIFEKGKGGESAVDKEKQIRDTVLDRALELLKAREVLSSLTVSDG